MKCAVVVVCGLADEAREDLGGKTPLEAARTPVLDGMASRGILGLTRTSARSGPAGCHVGGLMLLGCEPAEHPIGAAALEAAGLGVALAPGDVALRANFVTLESLEDGSEVLADPLGGRLPAAEAAAVARDLAARLAVDGVTLVPGVGHRHLLVWRGGEAGVRTTSPYALVDKPAAGGAPSGTRSEVLAAVMERTRALLAEHPLCLARRARAERVPTVLWPWDPAVAASLPSTHDAFGIDGAIVAGTPIGRGLGVALGLQPVDVPGATGDVDTDFRAKADAALGALATRDLAVVHVAACDVAAHGGDVQRKVTAIERLDDLLMGPLADGLRQLGGDWRILVAADHVTTCATRAHNTEPVPFCIYTMRDETKVRGQKRAWTEKDAREQGIFIQHASTLLEQLLRH
jgi:2,3-bisphosphoglycerate-independent phosphoglycerate mutase